jgi:hypothetical protein
VLQRNLARVAKVNRIISVAVITLKMLLHKVMPGPLNYKNGTAKLTKKRICDDHAFARENVFH